MLRIPSGKEAGAYAGYVDANDQYHSGQWRPKGVTEGGKREAVIDKLSLDQLNAHIKNKAIEIVEEKSLAENTKRVIEEKKAVI
jgi:hypothetical protein